MASVRVGHNTLGNNFCQIPARRTSTILSSLNLIDSALRTFAAKATHLYPTTGLVFSKTCSWPQEVRETRKSLTRLLCSDLIPSGAPWMLRICSVPAESIRNFLLRNMAVDVSTPRRTPTSRMPGADLPFQPVAMPSQYGYYSNTLT